MLFHFVIPGRACALFPLIRRTFSCASARSLLPPSVIPSVSEESLGTLLALSAPRRTGQALPLTPFPPVKYPRTPYTFICHSERKRGISLHPPGPAIPPPHRSSATPCQRPRFFARPCGFPLNDKCYARLFLFFPLTRSGLSPPLPLISYLSPARSRPPYAFPFLTPFSYKAVAPLSAHFLSVPRSLAPAIYF